MARARPTILQIIPELDTGGAERTTVEIAEAIVKAGGRAIVLSEGGRMAADVTAAGGDFVAFPARTKNPAKLNANARAIAAIVARENVDLIHARSRAPAWSALMAARRTRLPFVTTYHGAYNETGRAKRLYNSVMARGDVVIANSQFTADLVRSRYGTPLERIRVVHRGVDGAVFDPAIIAEDRKQRLRSAWGVPAGARVVLHAARLTGWKGQGVVIEAARRLLASHPELAKDTFVALAGDAQGRDAYRQGLAAEISGAGLAGNVRLVGHCDDMPAAFGASWLGVVASTEPEAFGRAATECQVMGCPVIATNIGAPPETVLTAANSGLAARTGWLVPPSDANALAAAMAEALTLTPDERAIMGTRARQHVLHRFSLAAMCRRTLEVYDSLLDTTLSAAYG